MTKSETDAYELEELERQRDCRWLGLELEEGGAVGHVQLTELHITPLDHLYGGMGLALSSALIEAVTRRHLRWATTQFIAVPKHGDSVRLHADVLAQGRRTSQVRVTAWVRGSLAFQALGAAGDDHREIRDGELPAAPTVPPPEECAPYAPRPPGATGIGYLAFCEMRDAGRAEVQAPRWWMRFPGRPARRPAVMAMMADVVPSVVMDALGEKGSGSSLDNTIRVGSGFNGEWALLEGTPEQAAGGYGYGSVRIWGSNGSLGGTASQTAALWLWREKRK